MFSTYWGKVLYLTAFFDIKVNGKYRKLQYVNKEGSTAVESPALLPVCTPRNVCWWKPLAGELFDSCRWSEQKLTSSPPPSNVYSHRLAASVTWIRHKACWKYFRQPQLTCSWELAESNWPHDTAKSCLAHGLCWVMTRSMLIKELCRDSSEEL